MLACDICVDEAFFLQGNQLVFINLLQIVDLLNFIKDCDLLFINHKQFLVLHLKINTIVLATPLSWIHLIIESIKKIHITVNNHKIQ